MRLIIEGPDGAGKSSIAQSLYEFTGGILTHKGPPGDHANWYNEYFTPIASQPPSATDAYLYDRWHLGEMIYGPKYRGKSLMTPGEFWTLEQHLNSIGVAMMRLAPDPIITAEILGKRGDDMVSTDDIVDICLAYRSTNSFITCEMIVGAHPVEMDDESLGAMIRSMMARAAQYRLLTSKVTDIVPSLFGAATPAIVFVYDRGMYRDPFTYPLIGSGAAFADEIVEVCNSLEQFPSTAFVDARDFNLRAWQALQFPQVAVLCDAAFPAIPNEVQHNFGFWDGSIGVKDIFELMSI